MPVKKTDPREDAAIAAFLARNGATQCAQGDAALNYSPRDWAKAKRGENPRPVRYTQHQIIDTRGHEWRVNEHGEMVYLG